MDSCDIINQRSLHTLLDMSWTLLLFNRTTSDRTLLIFWLSTKDTLEWFLPANSVITLMANSHVASMPGSRSDLPEAKVSFPSCTEEKKSMR